MVLPISTDGDDQRIFWGFKILIQGFFWVGKFDKDLFGWLDLHKDFLGYSEQSEDHGSAHVYILKRSSANKVQPNLFSS